MKKELKQAVLQLEHGKGLLKDGYRLFMSLMACSDEILAVLKMPVTQQRLHLPEKLRALQKLITGNGMKERFADLISAFDIQQHKDEDFINEDMMKYAPNIEKM